MILNFLFYISIPISYLAGIQLLSYPYSFPTLLFIRISYIPACRKYKWTYKVNETAL